MSTERIMADSERHSQKIEIVNRRGLHARASAKFVKLAETFNANILVAKDGVEVIGTSIMGLMLLAAGPGDILEVSATGEQAEAALQSLLELIQNRFDEEI